MKSTLEAAPVVVDRCDRCGAAAVVVAESASMALHFCQHHINEQRAALITKGWTVTQKS